MINLSKKDLLLALILLSVIVFTLLKYNSIFSTAILFFSIILFLLNHKTKKIAKEGYQEEHIDKRNFEYLLLGSSSVWASIRENKIQNEELVSYAFFSRSLNASFLILKHKFSYLRRNGKVLISIDCSDLESCISGKLHFPDMMLLHRITLNKLKISHFYLKYSSSFPIIFVPLYSFKLLRLKKYLNNSLPNKKELNRDQDMKRISELLLEMIEFCHQRELEPKIFLIKSIKTESYASAIQKEITLNNKGINIVSISNADQILKTIHD